MVNSKSPIRLPELAMVRTPPSLRRAKPPVASMVPLLISEIVSAVVNSTPIKLPVPVRITSPEFVNVTPLPVALSIILIPVASMPPAMIVPLLRPLKPSNSCMPNAVLPLTVINPLLIRLSVLWVTNMPLVISPVTTIVPLFVNTLRRPSDEAIPI